MTNNNNFVLAEAEFVKVKKTYKSFFKELNESIFEEVSDKYEELYNKVLQWIDKGKKFGGSAGRGRTTLQYWRNMLYGWYFERLLFEFLKLSKKIESSELFGTDNEHNVSLEGGEIKISGLWTTKPDFKLKTIHGNEWTIEVLTAAKGIYTIKEPKVQMASKTYGEYGLHTFFIMFDLINGKYSIVSPLFFVEKIAYPNTRMEGKLCYDLPTPHKLTKEVLNEDFDSIMGDEEKQILEKDWEIYKKFHICEDKEERKKMKNQIRIKRLEKQKKAFIGDIDKKIKKLN